ncbi:MAG TPA: S41 family peptidase [Gammaproteobacteria bacterium]|jgi:hypothetical protein
MRVRSLALVLSLFFVAPAGAQIAIPDTPAGRTLAAWLEAFNSGNQAQMAAYAEKYGSDQPVEAMLRFRTQTGGFELLGIDKSEPLAIEYRVKERASPTQGVGRMVVAEGEPARVTGNSLRAIPPGATVVGFAIDAETRNRVIDNAIVKLKEIYVLEDEALAMAEALEAHRSRGDYDAVTNGEEFARLLTQHLREVSMDLHLNVNFSPVAMPPPPQAPTQPSPQQLEQMRRQMEQINCGFEKLEILPGNVGYLKFNMFANPEICGATATTAMAFLQNVAALIVDMRDNGGGDPAMVAHVSTYLFADRTHLNDLWTRSTGETKEYWTLPELPGKRLAAQPVYVLTSSRTFSGGEEFTYNLKSLGRATIVGETTGGGAHPVRGERIDDRFTIAVPFARAINPITQTNWEGTGVAPDIAVPAADALEKAKELVRQSAPPPGPR